MAASNFMTYDPNRPVTLNNSPNLNWQGSVNNLMDSYVNKMKNASTYDPSNMQQWVPQNAQVNPNNIAIPSMMGAENGMLDGADMADAWGSGMTGSQLGLPTGGAEGFNWGSLVDSKGLGGMIKGGLDTGVGIFNAWMGQKNQKFLQDYYGQQQNLQKADFANNAKMTNLKLEDRISNRLSSNGISRDSAEGKAQVADYMGKWKVKDSL